MFWPSHGALWPNTAVTPWGFSPSSVHCSSFTFMHQYHRYHSSPGPHIHYLSYSLLIVEATNGDGKTITGIYFLGYHGLGKQPDSKSFMLIYLNGRFLLCIVLAIYSEFIHVLWSAGAAIQAQYTHTVSFLYRENSVTITLPAFIPCPLLPCVLLVCRMGPKVLGTWT